MPQDKQPRRKLPNGSAGTPIVSRRAPRATEAQPASSSVVRMGGESTEVLGGLLSTARPALRPHRSGEYLHVSDLISKCARKRALIERDKVAMAASRLSLMDALTYRQGDAIHDVIKEVAASAGPGSVWGKWSCQCGAAHRETPCTLASVPMDERCERCDTPTTKYEEVSVYDYENKIVGHPDLILWMQQYKAYYVTELKSISAKLWGDLVRPNPDHVIQVLMYWRMMRLSGYPVTDNVSILYITKGYEFKGKPYKEFVINAESSEERLTPFIDDAKAIVASRAGGPLPLRTQCAARTAPDAKSCEVVDQCFNDGAAKPIRLSFTSASAKGSRG